MLQVYRIANPLYIHDRSGEGARLKGGRWNHIGVPVLYAASSIALAAWEVRVHLPNNIIPRDDAFSLAVFTIPDSSIFDVNESLPSGWQHSDRLTKDFSKSWIDECRFLCMKVPSTIVTHEFNYLINPLHPMATQVVIDQVLPFVFDSRTFTL